MAGAFLKFWCHPGGVGERVKKTLALKTGFEPT